MYHDFNPEAGYHEAMMQGEAEAQAANDAAYAEAEAEAEAELQRQDLARVVFVTEGISALPNNAVEVQQYADICKTQILEGLVDFREALRRKKLMDMVLEQVFKDPEVKRHLEDEYAKHGQKEIQWHGAKISFSSRKSYTYDQCSDSELTNLEAIAKEADAKLKARQKFLQNLTKPMADGESGELIYPAAFTTTDYFTVSIKYHDHLLPIPRRLP